MSFLVVLSVVWINVLLVKNYVNLCPSEKHGSLRDSLSPFVDTVVSNLPASSVVYARVSVSSCQSTSFQLPVRFASSSQ